MGEGFDLEWDWGGLMLVLSFMVKLSLPCIGKKKVGNRDRIMWCLCQERKKHYRKFLADYVSLVSTVLSAAPNCKKGCEMCGLSKNSGDTVAQIKVESSVDMEEEGNGD